MQHPKTTLETPIETSSKQTSDGNSLESVSPDIHNVNHEFLQDVVKGLNSLPKQLYSKYFYDSEGDKIFQKIMAMEEYYLTNAEFEILDSYKQDFLQQFSSEQQAFDLIEFGAGDGYKTKLLLEHFTLANANFKYIPIDISGNILQILHKNVKDEFPNLNIEPIEGEYFQSLEILQKSDSNKKVVLFLGANIGNFDDTEIEKFIKHLADDLHTGDMVLIGFDLKKNPESILEAYNDKKGITRDLNLNLLKRINNNLGGNFDINSFQHFPSYNPINGETTSFLVSTKEQEVYLEKADAHFHFKAWEAIHMEISRKFDIESIERFAGKAGFTVVKNYYDSKGFFVDSLWQKA
ncbi:MAG: L-histidine N(alpha)-methyltransferase [Spirochaetota bacterium]